MNEYGKHITHNSPAPLLTHDPVQVKKAARRKVLEDVERRRRENYQRFYRKMQVQAEQDTNTFEQ
jgi:hypothetical protein